MGAQGDRCDTGDLEGHTATLRHGMTQGQGPGGDMGVDGDTCRQGAQGVRWFQAQGRGF